jgi:glycerol-3-phosphate dehydrogenase
MLRRRRAKPRCSPYRRLAEHALEKLSPYLPQMSGAWTERAALPGGDLPGADFSLFLTELRRRRPWLPHDVARGYARRYGTRVESLLNGAKSISDLGRSFGGTLYEREARFLAEEEWATDAEDILERRTKHALHLTAEERAEFTAWFQMLTPQAA